MAPGTTSLSARIRDVDATISRRPIAYVVVSIGIIVVVGLVAYVLGQADLTVVLSLLTLYAGLRFRNRRVYLLVLTVHVAATFGVMSALRMVPLITLMAATASVWLYAELSFRGARSRERIDAERQRHLLNLDLLEQVRTAIARELDVVAVARLAVEATARVTGYPRVMIYSVSGDALVLMHQIGCPSPRSPIPMDTGILARAIRNGTVQFQPETQLNRVTIGRTPGDGSEIAAPIFDGEIVIAGISVGSSANERRFPLKAADVALVDSVAQEIGIALSRARLHESAQRERAQFEHVTRALGQPLFVYDHAGVPVFINKAFERLLGWTLPELQDRTLGGLVEPEQLTRLLAEFEGWRAGAYGASEALLAHRDGTRIPFMVSTSPRSLTGASDGGVAVLTDLRDVKRAQQALEASEQRFRALYLESERQRRELEALDSVRDAILGSTSLEAVFDVVADFIHNDLHYANVAIGRLDGDELALLCARGPEELPARSPLTPVSRLAVTRMTPIIARDAPLDELLPLAPNALAQICVPLIDGGTVYGTLVVRGGPTQELGDDDLRILTLIGQNLSLAIARAKLFSDLETARDLALHASRAKSEFLTMMSHELRTPLNVILGGTELLGATLRHADQIELAHMTTDAGENLLAIINDVLDLARIEAGKMEVALEDTAIEPIARAAFRLLEAQAAGKGIQMMDHTDGSASMVRCDPKRTRQVLLNLLANAIKFTETGSIELSVARDGAHVRVTITDTGHGIEPATIGRLFQPFSQAGSSSSRGSGGTGLGLAISRQLVELMQGKIGVHSTPGKGSAFWFTLPTAPTVNRIITELP